MAMNVTKAQTRDPLLSELHQQMKAGKVTEEQLEWFLGLTQLQRQILFERFDRRTIERWGNADAQISGQPCHQAPFYGDIDATQGM